MPTARKAMASQVLPCAACVLPKVEAYTMMIGKQDQDMGKHLVAGELVFHIIVSNHIWVINGELFAKDWVALHMVTAIMIYQ